MTTPNGTPTPTGPTSPPSDTPTPTGPTSPPSDTSSSEPGHTPPSDQSSQPPGSGDTGKGNTDTPAEQKKQIEDVMTRLDETKGNVPEELAPTVDELTTTLEAVEDPDTSLQDRQGVIESIRHLTTALTATGDDSTPPKLRKQLIPLVKQASSALKVGYDSQVPSEKRSALLLIMKRTTSTLHMICDPETPAELRGQLMTISRGLSHAVEDDHQTISGRLSHAVEDDHQTFSRGLSQTVEADHQADRIREFEKQMGIAQADAVAPEMSPENREELVQAVYEQNEKLEVFDDPESSPMDRAEAENDMQNQSARMSNQQEDAALAQGQPEDPLGKAAEVCTNAIFESTAEHRLTQGLEDLIPDSWGPEGVKDFWKTKEKSSILLDVLAELRNNANVHAPIKISQLATELARIVPMSELWPAIGTRASYCQSTAAYLDEDYGVSVGSWLE
ncbi:hypothetical protein [Streptomyces sp. NBC_00151]|uniref:hypothetical protein n=1 Tax=Streptomyces sp. NBC_00151 TaxID=2975669 RepID=UPI002DDAA93C|nr:hypothetical protein [Streptomyces sp. NBC_00151]WRZ41973.1 hypothetical protein OG915_30385 [Streptomyces sp. NBC_00151]